jgi:hypothetical protein
MIATFDSLLGTVNRNFDAAAAYGNYPVGLLEQIRTCNSEERALLIRGAEEEEDLVNSGLEETMATAFQQIRSVHTANPKIPDLRTAALSLAIDKIARS